jgi:Uma2 family endonuclease
MAPDSPLARESTEGFTAGRPQAIAVCSGMAQAAQSSQMSFHEYVEFERTADAKHEFLDGRVWAMAGGTLEHAQLAANIIGELRARLERGPCKVFSADARIRVAATGLATYPDVTVICGPIERDPEDVNTATNPAAIVEVLSDSSEAYDRGDKFAHYRQIATLRTYVLVSQHEPRIEIYRRNSDDTWTLEDSRLGGDAKIPGLCSIPVSAVYADVELPPAPSRAR